MSKLNKSDLYGAIKAKVDGATKKDIEIILNAYADVVLETIKDDIDSTVPFPGIGKFSGKSVPERRGISQIGEKTEWVKPAHNELAFKISKAIKEF